MSIRIEWAEETRKLPGYGAYFASISGHIISTKYGNPRVLKPIAAEDGHLYVFLYDGHGRSKKTWVHCAILRAFVGEPGDGQETRHLDGNPANNWAGNLAWGTKAENVEDRRRHGRMPIPHLSQFAKLVPSDIPIIRALHGKQSSRMVASTFHTSHVTIQKIWRRERWKGY